jgi:BlaI family transcriptional regulator, penicillinase repressor
MKQLTKAEEEIMQILWKMEKAYVKEIIAQLDTSPAYNTVSTIVRILEKKGFVAHESIGKSHKYYPIIRKTDYTEKFMNNVVRNYFKNSWKELVRFFNKHEDISLKDLEEMKAMIETEIERKKSNNE